jgi:hypothetical protein
MQQQENFSQEDAAHTFVTATELVNALAAIDSRKAISQGNEDGKIIIQEAIEQIKGEYSAEEIAAQIAENQKREDEISRASLRQKREQYWNYALVLLVSVLISTAIVLYFTVFNPTWESEQQIKSFQKLLPLTVGQNAPYHIVIAPNEASILEDSYWENPVPYPISMVPDGYTIYSGSEAPIQPWFMTNPFADPSLKVVFLPSNQEMDHQVAFTHYQGMYYYRGWIPSNEVPRLEHHDSFFFYQCIDREPGQLDYIPSDATVPLTVPFESITQQNTQYIFCSNFTEAEFFLEGQTLKLDKHAWENW